MKRFAYLLPLIAGTGWGCTGLFVRTLDDAGFDNITITVSRVVVMLLMIVLGMLVYDRSLFRVRKKDLPLLAVIGINGLVLMNICYNISITTLSMSLASILLCTAPVFVIIIGRILFGERITVLRVVCMLGALLGCVLLSGIVESGELKWSVLGLAMGVASSFTNAAYVITLKEATDVRKIHPLTIQLYCTVIGLVVMLPFADYGVMVDFVAQRPLFATLFLLAHALVASLLPNLLYAIAFVYIDSSVGSILASGAEPTAAMLCGMIVYHEMPTVFGIIGMVIVIVSMIVLSKSDGKTTDGLEKTATAEMDAAGEKIDTDVDKEGLE